MKKSELRNIIREIIQEINSTVGNEWGSNEDEPVFKDVEDYDQMELEKDFLIKLKDSMDSETRKEFEDNKKIKEEILLEVNVKNETNKFVKLLNKKYNNPKDKFGSYVFDVKFGKKFAKITAKPLAGAGLSAWGFIAQVDQPEKGIRVGDLLKAASWSAPAKHARGNIIDGTAKYDKYGPAYIR